MWKEVPRTRKKEVLSSHHVESSRPSLTTASLLKKTYTECYSITSTEFNNNRHVPQLPHRQGMQLSWMRKVAVWLLVCHIYV